MKKVIKMIFYTLMILLFLSLLGGLYVWREFGSNPSVSEKATYENLPYYKNGEFKSPERLVYNFKNVRNGPASFARFLKKSIFAPQEALPKVILSNNSFTPKPSDFAIYWLGHSAGIMELNGKRFIFDPVFDNAAPIPFAVPRYGKTPIKRNELPKMDYIVITHNHYDHLERKTIQSVKEGHFIVPLGVGATLRSWGIDKDQITELGWGDVFEQNGFKIIAEEGVHYSNRSPFNRNQTLWNSYVIISLNKKIFWGGDTGYGKHFSRIGKDYGPFDFAALEIDGWNTGWENTHMFPDEVVKAAEEIGTKRLLPIHWAVFDLALHPWHESIDMVLDKAQNKDFIIFTPKMGERIDFNNTTSKWW